MRRERERERVCVDVGILMCHCLEEVKSFLSA
jgi:hypothetical protein